MNELSNPEKIVVAKDEKLAPPELHLALANESSATGGQVIGADQPVLSESFAGSSPESDQPESENCASVDLAIQSSALSVSLRSRASLNPDVIALNAQVRLLTEQLAEAQLKIDEANYKVGFLEAQLYGRREKRQQIETPAEASAPVQNEPERKRIGNLLRVLFPGN